MPNIINGILNPKVRSQINQNTNNISNQQTKITIIENQVNELSLNIPKWEVTGESVDDRNWKCPMIDNSHYKISYHWANPTDELSCKEVIVLYANNTYTPIETFTESIISDTVVGINVITEIDIAQLTMTNTGFNINNKTGSTSVGRIIKVEKLV